MPNYFFLVWIVLIGFMFYFMMIKPAKRQRAQQVDLLTHLAPGAEVRTNAHILGTVTEVGDEWVIVETTPGVKLKIGKPAIVAIILPDEPDSEFEPEAEPESETASGSDAADANAETVVVDAVPAEAPADPAGEVQDQVADTIETADSASKS